MSQFLQAPQIPHLTAGIHVLRYLLNAPDLGILLSGHSDFSMVAFFDSDWVACAQSRKFVTGYFITLGVFPASWKCKIQPIVSLSSAEAKYRALRKVVAKISWLIRLFSDLGLTITSVPVFCDSQAALHIAKNPVFHERTKHIEVDCHYIRESLSAGLISLHHVSTHAQLADIFTKDLPGHVHHHFLPKLGVFTPFSLKGDVGPIPYIVDPT